MIQRIIAYHLAFLILFTNIGVPVFTHVCNGQGKSWTSVFGTGRTCCSKKKAKKEKNCHPVNLAVSKQGIQSKPCCENFVNYQQQQSECYNTLPFGEGQHPQKAVFLPHPDFSFVPFTIVKGNSTSFSPHAPPAKLHGRSLLIFEQTFLC